MKNKLRIIGILLLGVLLNSCQQTTKTSPQRKNVDEAVFGNGFIEREHEFVISASASGVLTAVNITEGDNLKANFLCATIKSDVQNTQLQDSKVVYSDAQKNVSASGSQLSQVQTQILQATQQLDLDKTNYERYKSLRQKNAVSQLDLDKTELQYKNSQDNVRVLQQKYKQTKDELSLNAYRSKIQVTAQQKTLTDYQITNEKAGQVIDVFKKTGEWVRLGDPIAKIGSGNYRVKLYISEEDISKVRLRQNVFVHLNTDPNKVYKAQVSKILPGFNTDQQSYEIEATFDKLPPNLFSGTQLQANIETRNLKNVLVIPTDFLSKGQFVELEDGTQKVVQIGSQNQDWTEIIGGLSQKDVIVKHKSK